MNSCLSGHQVFTVAVTVTKLHQCEQLSILVILVSGLTVIVTMTKLHQHKKLYVLLTRSYSGHHVLL